MEQRPTILVTSRYPGIEYNRIEYWIRVETYYTNHQQISWNRIEQNTGIEQRPTILVTSRYPGIEYNRILVKSRDLLYQSLVDILEQNRIEYWLGKNKTISPEPEVEAPRHPLLNRVKTYYTCHW